MQFLITAIVVGILLVGVASSYHCYPRFRHSSYEFIFDCSGGRLDSIPADLPDAIDGLDLSYNNIQVIEDNAFSNLPNLKYLYLDFNKITSIKSDTFNNLPNLKLLDLEYNDISVIEDNAFNNLLNLRKLRLQHNDISVIEDNAFNNLPNLKDLYLHDNKITSIKSETFINLKNLYELYLQNNGISVIEDNAFNNLPNLQKLYMESNPISFVSENAFENLPQLTTLVFDMHCGSCDNIPFWRWLNGNQKFSTSITCHDYDREKLSNLQPNNFTDCFTCVDGTYGQNCSQHCSNNCYNNTCHVVSGLCLSGCRKGWMGSYCKQQCTTGRYGVNCEYHCGTCVNRICSRHDGSCEYGCIEGFKGDGCHSLVAPKSADNYTAVYTGVGSFVVTALVAVIVFATLRYRRKKKYQRRTARAYDSVTFSGGNLNIGADNTEPHYAEVLDAPYDTILT